MANLIQMICILNYKIFFIFAVFLFVAVYDASYAAGCVLIVCLMIGAWGLDECKLINCLWLFCGWEF